MVEKPGVGENTIGFHCLHDVMLSDGTSIGQLVGFNITGRVLIQRVI